MEVVIRKDVSKLHTCEYCHSVLKYQPQDIETFFPSIEAINCYGSEAIPMDYITCPVCNRCNFIKI